MKKGRGKSYSNVVPALVIGVFVLAGVAFFLKDGLITGSRSVLAGVAPANAPVNPNSAPPFVCLNCGLIKTNRLSGKNLSNAYITGYWSNVSDFSNSIFKNAFISFGRGSFSDNFSNADFSGAFLSGLIADTSNFSNAIFTDASLKSCRMARSDFTGANFTNADLSDCVTISTAPNIFTNAVWSNTTCADGTNSDNNGGTCIGHLNGQ